MLHSNDVTYLYKALIIVGTIYYIGYSKHCNRNARSWNIYHFIYMIFLILVEWKPKAGLYRKLLSITSTIPPILNSFQYNHFYPITHIYIYNIHITLCIVLISSLMLYCAYIFYCAKAFSFILVIVINDDINLFMKAC